MKDKEKIIVDGSIQFLQAEGILPTYARNWDFSESYVAPDHSVMILANSYFFVRPKVNIEIDYQGQVYDRLAGPGEDGKGIHRYTNRNYFDYMKQYINEAKKDASRER